MDSQVAYAGSCACCTSATTEKLSRFPVVRYDQTMHELHVWLQQLPVTLGRSLYYLLTCTPAAVLVLQG